MNRSLLNSLKIKCNIVEDLASKGECSGDMCVTFIDSKIYDPSIKFPGGVVVMGNSRDGTKEKFLKKPIRLVHVMEVLRTFLSSSENESRCGTPELGNNPVAELKVLIVEDNPMNQIVIRKMLIQSGKK